MIIRVNEVIIIRIDGASDRIVNTRSILIGVETDPESLLYVIDNPLALSVLSAPCVSFCVIFVILSGSMELA